MNKVDVLIAGGGISGLATLHFVTSRHPHLTVRLVEAAPRLGGTIGTDVIDGFSFDWGPNGFLDREPLTLQLCRELGLESSLEPANQNVSNRFILRQGKLRSVPMKPAAFLLSDILSWQGKLRVMMEPFGAKRPDGIDESIYDFGKRRIGREAADYLIQPMVSGVYGGVAEKLSLQSCFPIMREMENEYGSLFKAMIAKARQARRAGKKAGGPAGPGGWLTSFRGGLYTLIEAFQSRYADRIHTGIGVTEISRNDHAWAVRLANGDTIDAATVVLAVPSYTGAAIVRKSSGVLADALAAIPYAPIAVVCTGYEAGASKLPLDGFGFLVPRKENRRILGSIWTSSIFSQRAPDGMVQLRTMVGGDGDHGSAKLNDAQLLDIVQSDLTAILGLSGTPGITRIYRWQHGIPQFRVGHALIMSRIEAELKRLGSLHVASNAYYGIGLNDCVKQAFRVAQQI
jgi:protoporphyrinogen/coproporphyrinogen III oxidase